ncbi:unnamed protein product [Clonostachys rosea]|uniref:TauD/TfdA-like domain-containing protein n=1 Tax=Bionectria ochroleuca TaxID=29856 RepID=A0ABY6TSZ6_BIOOC|nr:unnamed protein product [Clonostachys rosea]
MESIITSLNYTAPLPLYKTEKPFYSNVPAPDGRQSNQVAWSYPDIQIRDIRSQLEEFTLDTHGFEVVKYGIEGIEENFDSDKWIEQNYYPVVHDLLKSHFGATSVKIFDHTVRKRSTPKQIRDLKENQSSLPAPRQPSYSVHCDQTFLSGENRIKLHMGAGADGLLRKRCRIINVWRPLFGPLDDSPLTFCDWQTVDVDRDYKAADLIFPHYIGEQFLVTYHPQHQWYFLGGQRSNEFTLLKCWDNKKEVARCVAHTSFVNPKALSSARPRESVEFRCMVFTNDV